MSGARVCDHVCVFDTFCLNIVWADDQPFHAGYPHNPYNGVICNDVIAASGVFTTKELWKYSKGKSELTHKNIIRTLHLLMNCYRWNFISRYLVSYNLFFFAASIMAGGSHMQASFNSIKLENPAYYCNSYTPPGPVDHHGMPLTSGYSECDFTRLTQLT